jgi:hypothetical protein
MKIEPNKGLLYNLKIASELFKRKKVTYLEIQLYQLLKWRMFRPLL